MEDYKVYKHVNKINGKVYIGVSNNVERRWRSNGIEYKPQKNRNQNLPFWNAIQKYGWESFESHILYSELSADKAFEKEIELIAKYNSTNNEFGYNVSAGGNGGIIYKEHPKGMLGKSQTKHQIESHREWASNHDNNCMKNGQVIWGKTHEHPRGMLGKTHSDEYKQKLSETMKGKGNPNAKTIVANKDSETLEFGCIQDCADYYETSYSTIFKLLKSGKVFESKYKRMKHLLGLTVNYK